MLVLTRKVGESFIIGDDIEVVVLKIEGSEVKIYKKIVEENLRASSVSVDSLKGVKVIDQDRRGTDQTP